MKTIHSSCFLLVSFVLAAFLGGCGAESEIKPVVGKIDDNGTIIPEANLEAPGPNWVGMKSEFALIFEEQDEVESSDALDFPRLFARANNSPHTGAITRLHLSRFIEFEGSYVDGFLEGIAREWDSSGSFIRMVHVNQGMIVGDEKEAKAEDKVASLPVPVPPASGDAVFPVDPIFVGTNDDLIKWTMTSVEDGIEYMLDKRSGNKVTGGFEVHDETTGAIAYYSEYKDGRLHGRDARWHSNGVTMEESNFANGVKNGMETFRDENGQKTYEATYSNGKLNGIMTTWTEGIKTEIHYLDDNKHGLETSWDENGTTIDQKSYLNGKLVPPNE